MLKVKVIFITLVVLFYGSAKIAGQEKSNLSNKRIKILILGTFHFGATSDVRKTDFDDLFSEKRQREINRIVALLAKYNPDKIFVENVPDKQEYWNNIYDDYKKGIEPVDGARRNEIFQIGVKLAKATNNEKGVICVDYQLQGKYDEALKNASDEVEKTFIRQAQAIVQAPDPSMANKEFFELPFKTSKGFKDLKLSENNLLDYYLWINTPENIARNHYINRNYNDLELGEGKNYLGAESVSLWYNRNLKILTNILRQASIKDNRYFLLIGAGHVKVLQDFFRDHPYFETISVRDVLGAANKKKSDLKNIKNIK
ncbi:MAG TPA: DUF5694 domain-containing protein [Pyrinomonadaceae bacterium]